MKIAVYHNLPTGGALRSTGSILERLSSRHTVDCFALSSSAHNGKAFETVCRTISVYDFRPRAADWPGRLRPLGWLIDLKRIAAVQQQIAAVINSQGYDVCFTSTCPFFELPSIHRYLKIPVVYYAHSTSYPPIARGRKTCARSRPRNPFGILLERTHQQEKQELIDRANAVVTNSYFSREELFRLYGVNAVVNYLGVDTNKFFPEAQVLKQRVVLGVGSLTRFKAHDFSIESVGTIPEPSRPELWIVHHFEEPGEKEYLGKLARNLGVRTTFYENASTEDLRRLYTAAAATVFPSVFEPLGLVPLESMACGTPVVGVAEGGTRETVLDGITGFLTQRDPEEFGKAVAQILERPDLAMKMGEAGRAHVIDKWNWDRSVAQLETILEKAARDGTRDRTHS